MLLRAPWVVGLVLLMAATPESNQDKKFTIKTASSEAPKELDGSIKKLLANDTVQFFDQAGTLICEVWMCKELPSEATAEQIKNGLTYRELKESQVVGAIRFEKAWFDYRKQKVKPGVYTLRVGFQPSDGDHAGKSQFTDFLLMTTATKDKNPEIMTHQNLVDMSGKSSGTGHPAVLMLFPNEKAGKVAIESRPREHWVVNVACPVVATGGRGTLGFGITLVGEADD